MDKFNHEMDNQPGIYYHNNSGLMEFNGQTKSMRFRTTLLADNENAIGIIINENGENGRSNNYVVNVNKNEDNHREINIIKSSDIGDNIESQYTFKKDVDGNNFEVHYLNCKSYTDLHLINDKNDEVKATCQLQNGYHITYDGKRMRFYRNQQEISLRVFLDEMASTNKLDSLLSVNDNIPNTDEISKLLRKIIELCNSSIIKERLNNTLDLLNNNYKDKQYNLTNDKGIH